MLNEGSQRKTKIKQTKKTKPKKKLYPKPQKYKPTEPPNSQKKKSDLWLPGKVGRGERGTGGRSRLAVIK